MNDTSPNITKPADNVRIIINIIEVCKNSQSLFSCLIHALDSLSTALFPEMLYIIKLREEYNTENRKFKGLKLAYGESVLEVEAEDDLLKFLHTDPKFIRQLESGQPFYGVTETLNSGTKRNALLKYGYSSVLIVPVFSDKQLWGALAFVEKDIPRLWDNEMIETVSHACDIIGINIASIEKSAELERKELFLSEAMENVNDGYWHIDILNNTIHFSTTWLKMLGFKPNELSPSFETFENLLHPDDKDTILQLLDPYKQGDNDTFECQYRIRNKNGNYLWIITKARIHRSPGGLPTQLVARNINITSRVHSKKKLEEEEKKYKNLIDSIYEIIFTINDRGQFTFLNSSWETFTGFSVNRTINTFALRYIHPDDRELAWSSFMQNEKGRNKTHKTFAVRFITRSGTSVWMEVNANTTYNKAGEVKEISGTLMNINERVLAEHGRKESEARFKQIAESIRDLIIEISDDDTLIYVSPASLPLLGVDPKDAIGRKASDFIHTDDHCLVNKEVYSPLIEGGVSSTFSQFRLKHANGSYLWVESLAHPIVINNKITFIAVLRDISLRKKAQEELERALAKEKGLSTLKSRFITMASHEFRTPLSSIKSSAELMEMYAEELGDRIPKPFLDHINKINEQVDRIGGLMNNILIAGAEENDPVPFNPEHADLYGFVKHFLTEEFNLDKYNRQIHLSVEKNPKDIMFDKGMMKQLLGNLFTNALKFSEGKPDPECKLVFEDHGVRIIVTDYGIGIPEDEQDQLFASFFRASNITNENIPGNGLGLFIVKRIVDTHGGHISVDSTEGIGTTVKVTLPYKIGMV